MNQHKKSFLIVLLVFQLIAPELSQACVTIQDNCVSPPSPRVSNWLNATATTISLSGRINPVQPTAGEPLVISVPPILATENCYQPSYQTYDQNFCTFPLFIRDKYYVGDRRQLQPVGTTTIKQNGVTVGTVTITTASTNYTTPPVQSIGPNYFVAQFTPSAANIPISSATSGQLMIFAGSLPVAVLGGPYSTGLNASVSIDGSKSNDPNPNTTIKTYKWNFGDGANTVTTVPNVQHTYVGQREGTYTVTLIVNDGWFDSAPATTTVNVRNLNWLPSVLSVLLSN